MEIYERQTEKRDSLSRETKEVLNQLIQEMRETKSLDNSHLADLLLQLADRLRFTSGKKQYGYLKAPLKSLVDEIVDELEKEPVVKEAYACWYELREEVLHSYRDDLPERLPLSRQKEFKNIKNLVILQAMRLGDDIQEEAESLSERAGPDLIPEHPHIQEKSAGIGTGQLPSGMRYSFCGIWEISFGSRLLFQQFLLLSW